MPFAQSKFRIIRRITLAGFTGDDDWLADFDAASARAAGSVTAEPRRSGQVDIAAAFLDVSGDLVDPGTATYELQMLLLAAGDIVDGGSADDLIFMFEQVTDHRLGPPGPPATETLNVFDIATLVRPIVGPSIFAFRVTNLMNIPGAATRFGIAIRVG